MPRTAAREPTASAWHDAARPRIWRELGQPGAALTHGGQSDLARCIDRRIQQATCGLLQTRPELSAGAPVWSWQKAVIVALLAMLLAAPLLQPDVIRFALAVALVVPFLAYAALRLAALAASGGGGGPEGVDVGNELGVDLGEAELPAYSVLVPLSREAAIVPDLVRALDRLSYPRDRLEILFALEADDDETRNALEAAPLGSHMRLIIVPLGAPRTKPRALNYALAEATGRYVAVYDAEDEPEPDQLRQACARFARSGERLGCVQARLNIYNPADSWLTRQFTIEYSSLFDHILPLLERHNLPVPLGGTSNHFPRAVLERIGGWDPFNVTEDADLGMRLARAGLDVAVLASTTFEEAPDGLSIWLGQRRRWLKGWMQTWLVHMREPRVLWRELGPRRFIWFQLIMGGSVISALVHPWFYGLALWDIAQGSLPGAQVGGPSQGTLAAVLWWATAANLAIGYGAAIALGMVAVRGRGRRELMAEALLMPLYWLAISVAAYGAAIDLVRRPSVWVKTPHKGRGGRR